MCNNFENIDELIIQSWQCRDGNINKTEELIHWINDLNKKTFVNIQEKSINNDLFWFYDDYNGEILNRKRSFFSIKGMRRFENGHFYSEQPVIIQLEIGYLGIICKKINGVLNFLMQAKIEPGNVNCVQISPTIQATKSNFTRVHGGKLPMYFEYFENFSKYNVIYDQIQSEQAGRFYKKRNRNMIMLIDAEIELYPNFKWMTLGQIKELMRIDNLVNMDARTVLSGLPLYLIRNSFSNDSIKDKSIVESMKSTHINKELPQIYQLINNYKMFQDIRMSVVPLYELVDWDITEFGVVCRKQSPFMVRFYDIEIEGREVRKWSQPLFKAIGMATFGLITTIVNGNRMFLIKVRPEFGSFDKVEMGPTVQWEPTHYLYDDDRIEALFRNYKELEKGIIKKVILSEEGGRFYHEQNENLIIDIPYSELGVPPEKYILVSYSTLSLLAQFNNVLNIQLRNLLSLLDI